MAEKTVMIIELVTKGNKCYSVGAIPQGLVSRVEKIQFFNTLTGYNKNQSFTGACYAVHLDDGITRRIIPMDEVVDIGVRVVEKESGKGEKKKSHPEAVAFESTTEEETGA